MRVPSLPLTHDSHLIYLWSGRSCVRVCVCVTLAVAKEQPRERRHVWRNGPRRSYPVTPSNREKSAQNATPFPDRPVRRVPSISS